LIYYLMIISHFEMPLMLDASSSLRNAYRSEGRQQ
jgi:hypothetical protein